MGHVIAWLALLMIVLGAYNALARWSGRFTGVDLSSNGLLEAQWYLFSLVFLLGAQYTLKHDAHVRVDVVYSRLGERKRALIDVFGALFMLLPFSIAVLVFTWPGVLESWTIREVSPDPGGLPRYPLKAVVLVAFVLVIVQGLNETLKRWLALRRADREEHR